MGTSKKHSCSEQFSSDSAKTPIYLLPDDERGCELASTLDLDRHDIQHAPTDRWYLGTNRGELALCHPTEPPLVISERSVRRKIDEGRHSNLAKACMARRGKVVLDAFGGWGIDGFALSVLGCDVTILEVNPLVCTMARYLAIELGCRVKFVCTDAEQYLQSTRKTFDVVYFDPMFPAHPKNAKPTRRMQVLEMLAWKDTDLDRVFRLANSRSRDRIVVKMRRTATPRLLVPDWSIPGRTIRFDVYRVQQSKVTT